MKHPKFWTILAEKANGFIALKEKYGGDEKFNEVIQVTYDALVFVIEYVESIEIEENASQKDLRKMISDKDQELIQLRTKNLELLNILFDINKKSWIRS